MARGSRRRRNDREKDLGEKKGTNSAYTSKRLSVAAECKRGNIKIDRCVYGTCCCARLRTHNVWMCVAERAGGVLCRYAQCNLRDAEGVMMYFDRARVLHKYTHRTAKALPRKGGAKGLPSVYKLRGTGESVTIWISVCAVAGKEHTEF